MKAAFERAWHSNASWLSLLKPLEYIFRLAVARRRQRYLSEKSKIYRAPVPVVVIGNISVGGVGKTPLVIAIANHLKFQGYNPGIVSRGYGATAGDFPRRVHRDSDPSHVGDEPLLIARHTSCPMMIDPNRPRAVERLLNHSDCDIIISDDGLQHYALARDVEIAVVDGQLGLGNGAMLPRGPLREPPERLQGVSFIVSNGASNAALFSKFHPPQFVMQIQPGQLINLKTGAMLDHQTALGGRSVHAVAGIGNPQRFYDTLDDLGIMFAPHSFADHHRFSASDFAFAKDALIVMTEKDAVKCTSFAGEDYWYLPIRAHLPDAFYAVLLEKIKNMPIKNPPG